MPTLTIQLPGQSPVEHISHDEVITLGRMPGNAFVLPDPSVSQSHARIIRIGGDYFLKDLKSTNGTLLNGRPIKESSLHDGDTFKLGEVVAIFHLAPATVPAPQPSAPMPAPVPTPPPPPPLPLPVPASDLEKSDTAILSAKAKTSPLKPIVPTVIVNPPAAPPGRKSKVALLVSVLGGVAVAGVVGYLAWKLAGDSPSESLAVQATPNPQPVSAPAVLPTNTPIIQTNLVETLPEPAPIITNQETLPPIMEAPVAPASEPASNLPDLLITLRSPDVAKRRYAAQEISTLGAGATNALLNLRIALLQDADPEVRLWLVAALVGNQTYDQATIPVLVESLKLENATLRQRACATLALIPCDDAGKAIVIPALKTATEDESEDVRKAALAALGVIAPEEVTGK